MFRELTKYDQRSEISAAQWFFYFTTDQKITDSRWFLLKWSSSTDISIYPPEASRYFKVVLLLKWMSKCPLRSEPVAWINCWRYVCEGPWSCGKGGQITSKWWISLSKNMCQGDHNRGACGPFHFVLPKVQMEWPLQGPRIVRHLLPNVGHCYCWTILKKGEWPIQGLDVGEVSENYSYGWQTSFDKLLTK